MKVVSIVSVLLVAGMALGCGKKDEGKEGKGKPPEGDKGPPASKVDEPTPPPAPAATSSMVAVLAPASGSNVKGTVTFTEAGGKVEVVAEVTGLEPGDHGFHIHEKGDCSAPDATSAGGHFNPTSVDHGGPEAAPHHAGDLGNLTADDKGTAAKTITSSGITLGEGEHSVAGRAVIVHAQPDDLKSQPTGAAGARVACGVIGPAE